MCACYVRPCTARDSGVLAVARPVVQAEVEEHEIGVNGRAVGIAQEIVQTIEPVLESQVVVTKLC